MLGMEDILPSPEKGVDWYKWKRDSCFLWRNTRVRLRVQVLVNAGVAPAPRSIVLLRGSLLLKSFFLERVGKVLRSSSAYFLCVLL